MKIETIELLLLIAAVVAMLARRLRIPYSIGLVIAGMALALGPFAPAIQLTKQLLFTTLLPPLIFEAAFQIRWPELKREMRVVLLLATVGVAISACATAAGMHYVVSWPWQAAIVFGILIAATDPVSVIAMFKDAKVHGRIRLLVEAESLLNDGTAAAAFTIALAFAAGEATGTSAVVKTFAFVVFGSILCGALAGGAALLLSGATKDHLIEITFSTIAAFGSFLLAEHFHASGVLATITAGLIMGNIGHLGMSSAGRRAVVDFWEYAAFVANSLIFLVIGLRLANESYRLVALAAPVAILVVIVARALAVYPLSLLFARTRSRLTWWQQHTLFWGGLRGALALGLALGIPETMPKRQEIIAVAFAVVAF